MRTAIGMVHASGRWAALFDHLCHHGLIDGFVESCKILNIRAGKAFLVHNRLLDDTRSQRSIFQTDIKTVSETKGGMNLCGTLAKRSRSVS